MKGQYIESLSKNSITIKPMDKYNTKYYVYSNTYYPNYGRYRHILLRKIKIYSNRIVTLFSFYSIQQNLDTLSLYIEGILYYSIQK